MIPNYHILTVAPMPFTDKRGHTIRIKSDRFKQSVIIPYTNEPGSANPTIETAVNYLKKKGIDTIGQGEAADGYYLITDNKDENGFIPLKPLK